MKRYFFKAWIVLLCLGGLCGLPGCSDDTPLQDGGQEQTKPAEHAWQLVGEWTLLRP